MVTLRVRTDPRNVLRKKVMFADMHESGPFDYQLP